MMSNRFQEKQSNERQIPLETSDNSHEIKDTKRLSCVVNFGITDDEFDLHEPLSTGSLIDVLLPDHVNFAINVPVMVVLCLAYLDPIVLGSDAILLQSGPCVVTPILEKLITAEKLILAINWLLSKHLHVEFLADVVDLHEAVFNEMLFDFFIRSAVDVLSSQLRIVFNTWIISGTTIDDTKDFIAIRVHSVFA